MATPRKKLSRSAARRRPANRRAPRQGVGAEKARKDKQAYREEGQEGSKEDIGCEEAAQEIGEEIREEDKVDKGRISRRSYSEQDAALPERRHRPAKAQNRRPPRKKRLLRVAKPSTAPARNSFYITTAIAYPNGVPHIGHAYEAIATDALARFQRLDGKDVFFLTGTDEHGLKMVQTAEAEKLPTMEVATRNAAAVQGDG